MVKPFDPRPVPLDQALEIRRMLAGATLHASTSPDAIRQSQQRDVADYFAAHPDATVAEASAELVLPVWSVECAIAALNGDPVPYRTRGVPVEDSRPWKLMHGRKKR